MTRIKAGIVGVLGAACLIAASAQSYAASSEIERAAGNPKAPFVPMVAVPPGFTTYYVSGIVPAVQDAKAAKGSPAMYGDTPTQVTSVLGRLKEVLAQSGLSFADVVQAHVYLAGDPAKGGEMDFDGLNKAWGLEFGTAKQPNRPARAAFKVAGLVQPGMLVEIELVAAKK